jgi:glycosyltransferase involved in cell wall biosynthesis
MSSRKAWLVSSNRWNSAITEYAISWACAMRLAGWEVTFSPLKDSPAETRARALGFHCLPITFTWQELVRGRPKQFEPKNFDVAIAFGGPESRYVNSLPRTVRKVRFRGNAIEISFFENVRQNVGLSGFDMIVTPSEALTGAMQKLLLRKAVKTVPLGVNEQKYFFAERAYGDGNKRHIVILGRLDPVKGHREFLDFYASAMKQGADLPKLHIVGEPANISDTEMWNAVLERGLKDKVLFTPSRVKDVASLLSGATLGVVSSLGSEIICRVAEEFLLCGCPILVTDVGSLPETLFPGAGSCYDPRQADPAILIRAVESAKTETIGARRERAAAARERFSLEKMSARIEEVLKGT